MDGLKLPIFLLILLLAIGWFLFMPSGHMPKLHKKLQTKTTDNTKSDVVEKALKEFSKHNYEAVVSLLGAQSSFKEYSVQKILAYSLAGLKRFDSSIVAFEKLLKIKRYPEDGYSLAYLYEVTGRMKVARMLYQDLLSATMKPKLKRRVYEGLARTANFENNTKLALKYSIDMVRYYPDSPLGFVSIFKLFKVIGKTKKLDKLIEIGDRYHKDNYEYNFWLGSLYFELADYDKALERFRACVRIDPDNSTPFYYSYRILKKQKNLESALRELEKYYNRNPLLPNVFFEAAVDAKNDGKIKLAYKFIRSALTMDSTLLGRDDQGTLREVERYVRRKGSQLDKMFMEAFMSYVNGDTDVALEQAKRLKPKVKGTKFAIEVNRIIGECYRLKSQDKAYAKYLAELEREKNLAKRAKAASKTMAAVVDDGETKIEEIKKRAMMNPNDLKKQYLAGLQLSRLGELKDAEVFFKNAIRLNPNILEPNFSLAKLLAFEKNYSEAKKYINKALEINPNSSLTLSLSATVKYEDGDIHGAESDANSALLANPNNGEAFLILAEVYSKNHRFDKAVEQIQQGLEVERDPIRRKRFMALKNSIRSY